MILLDIAGFIYEYKWYAIILIIGIGIFVFIKGKNLAI